MGVSDYILPYYSEVEKNRINYWIRKYERYYSMIPDRVKNLKLIREENWKTNDEEDYIDFTDAVIRSKYPHIDFTGIDVENECIAEEYAADLLIQHHSDIEFKDGEKPQRAIRVFFHFGGTSSFGDYIERVNIRIIDTDRPYEEICVYENEFKDLNPEEYTFIEI